MIDKREFDKILVELMRNFPFFKNSALVDAEGIPISFAVKSREYKTNPAMIGSKTNALSFLSTTFSNNSKISAPLIQFLFFKKITLIFIDLQIADLFILMDIKGWPPKGNVLAEYFEKLNELIPHLVAKEKSILGMLEEGAESAQKDLEKIPADYLTKIANNMDFLSEIKLDYKSSVKSAEVFPDYFTTSLRDADAENVLQLCIFNDNNEAVHKTPETSDEFCEEVIKFFNGNLIETGSFNYGDLIWTLNIFEDDEVLIVAPIGKIKQYSVYAAILSDNYGDSIKSVLNLAYKMNKGMSQIYSGYLSGLLKDSIEILYLPPSQIKKKIELKLKEKKIEDSLELMERVALFLTQNSKFSEAGDYYEWMADLYKKEGDVEKSLIHFSTACNSHIQGKSYLKAGDCYFQIGQIYELNDSKPEAFENYNLSIEYFKKVGGKDNKIKEIKDRIREINKHYKSQISDYLNSSDGTSYRLEHLSEKFGIERNYLITVMKSLLKQGQIEGQLNVLKERYTKEKIGSGEIIIDSPEAEIERIKTTRGAMRPVITADKMQIITEKKKIDETLVNYENIFEQINLPFLKYIEYQDQLSKSQFLEQQLKILDSRGDLLSPSGTPEKCIICLKKLAKDDDIVTCTKNHGYHVGCFNLWIKTQDTCPGDGTKLVPHALNIAYIDTLNDTESVAFFKNKIDELKEQLKAVKKELKETQDKLFLIESVDSEKKSMFEKFLREKDLRKEYENEVKKKEQMIKELKSILEMIPKSLSKND